MKRMLTVAVIAGGLLLAFEGAAHAGSAVGVGTCPGDYPRTCAGVGEGSTSSGNGNCADSSSNSNSASNSAAASGWSHTINDPYGGVDEVAAAAVQTQCDSAGDSSVAVATYESDVGYTYAGWGSTHDGSCSTTVQRNIRSTETGCPAGQPPTVPAALP